MLCCWWIRCVELFILSELPITLNWWALSLQNALLSLSFFLIGPLCSSSIDDDDDDATIYLSGLLPFSPFYYFSLSLIFVNSRTLCQCGRLLYTHNFWFFFPLTFHIISFLWRTPRIRIEHINVFEILNFLFWNESCTLPLSIDIKHELFRS